MILGGVGLLTPVSVSPDDRVVACGSAVAPDLSEARGMTGERAAGVAQPDAVAAGTDYVELCRMDLEDRRIWTISLIAMGAAATAVGVVLAHKLRHASGRGSPLIGQA